MLALSAAHVQRAAAACTTLLFAMGAVRLQVDRGHCSLSLLPPWHIYERTVSYYIWSCGGRQVHSSIKRFKADLAAVQPNFLVCVPLLLDTLHARIMTTIKKSGEVKAAVAMWLISCAEQHIRVRAPVARSTVMADCISIRSSHSERVSVAPLNRRCVWCAR